MIQTLTLYCMSVLDLTVSNFQPVGINSKLIKPSVCAEKSSTEIEGKGISYLVNKLSDILSFCFPCPDLFSLFTGSFIWSHPPVYLSVVVHLWPWMCVCGWASIPLCVHTTSSSFICLPTSIRTGERQNDLGNYDAIRKVSEVPGFTSHTSKCPSNISVETERS